MTEDKDLLNLFTEGAIFKDEGDIIVVNTKPVGMLKLHSGKIIACDPSDISADYNYKPLSPSIAPGVYPVDVAFATLKKSDGSTDQRVAAARIKFKDNPVVKWVLAMSEDDQKKPLKENDVRGYPIESGVSCFFDAEGTIVALATDFDLIVGMNPEAGT